MNSQRRAVVLDTDVVLIAAAELEFNFLDLQDQKLVPVWHGMCLSNFHSSKLGHSHHLINQIVQLMPDTRTECPILTVPVHVVIPFTAFLLISLVMTCPETARSHGISTGTLI
jgi:hypothetical protein